MNIKERAIDELITEIEDADSDTTLEDVFDELFNRSCKFYSEEEARESLEDYDLFEVVKEISSFEKDVYGEVSTDFSSPCDVANMYWYICGEHLIGDITYFCGIGQDIDLTEDVVDECVNFLKEVDF